MSKCKCGCTQDAEKNCDGTHKSVITTPNKFWPICKACNNSFHVDHYQAHQLTHKEG